MIIYNAYKIRVKATKLFVLTELVSSVLYLKRQLKIARLVRRSHVAIEKGSYQQVSVSNVLTSKYRNYLVKFVNKKFVQINR
jgi:hypothetical protein